MGFEKSSILSCNSVQNGEKNCHKDNAVTRQTFLVSTCICGEWRFFNDVMFTLNERINWKGQSWKLA